MLQLTDELIEDGKKIIDEIAAKHGKTFLFYGDKIRHSTLRTKTPSHPLDDCAFCCPLLSMTDNPSSYCNFEFSVLFINRPAHGLVASAADYEAARLRQYMIEKIVSSGYRICSNNPS